MYIPHEAIDAAARSMSETCSEGKLPWHNYLVDARLALEAAAPILLEMAFDNGFTACGREWMTQQQDPSHPITRVNPYRG